MLILYENSARRRQCATAGGASARQRPQMHAVSGMRIIALLRICLVRGNSWRFQGRNDGHVCSSRGVWFSGLLSFPSFGVDWVEGMVLVGQSSGCAQRNRVDWWFSDNQPTNRDREEAPGTIDPANKSGAGWWPGLCGGRWARTRACTCPEAWRNGTGRLGVRAHREGRGGGGGDELRGGGEVGVVVIGDEQRYPLAELGEEHVVLQHLHLHLLLLCCCVQAAVDGDDEAGERRRQWEVARCGAGEEGRAAEALRLLAVASGAALGLTAALITAFRWWSV